MRITPRLQKTRRVLRYLRVHLKSNETRELPPTATLPQSCKSWHWPQQRLGNTLFSTIPIPMNIQIKNPNKICENILNNMIASGTLTKTHKHTRIRKPHKNCKNRCHQDRLSKLYEFPNFHSGKRTRRMVVSSVSSSPSARRTACISQKAQDKMSAARHCLSSKRFLKGLMAARHDIGIHRPPNLCQSLECNR